MPISIAPGVVALFNADDALIATFTTIQDAVDAASANFTIRVGAGTYREQVLVDGIDGLTIKTMADAVIEMPDSPLFTHFAAGDGGARDRAAVVTVRDSSDVTIEGFIIYGRGLGEAMPGGTNPDFEGVLFFDASGVVTENTVTGIRDALNGDGTPKGAQRGNAIVAINDDGAARPVAITGNTIEDFQKNGVVASGAGLTATIADNTVTGSGFLPASTAIAQNGIQLSGGAGGVVDGNTVSELGLQRSDAVATYILIFSAADGVEVTNNMINGVEDPAGTAGIYVLDADSAVVTGNEIESILFGVTFSNGFDGPTATDNVFTNPVPSLTPFIGGSNPPTLAAEPFIGSNYGVYGDANTLGLTFSASDGVDELFGTSQNDVLSGLGGDDVLFGGEGDDTLDGGDDFDTAIFEGGLADHKISFTGGPGATVASFDTVADVIALGGSDTLIGIETLEFDDATLDLGDPVFLVDDGGFIIGSFLFIQDAIDAASDDFTVLVSAGTYEENLTVPVGVTIKGANTGLAGDDEGRGVETVIIGQMDVSAGAGFALDGVEVRNTADTSGGYRGVTISGAGDHTIINSVFFSEVAGGPNATGDYAVFTNSLASGSVTIADNYFTGDFTGSFDTASWNRAIWLNGGGIDRTVTGNVIEFARTGVNIEQAAEGTLDISGNAIANSGTGFAYSDPAPAVIDFFVNNTFDTVGTDFNGQNLTTGVTFDVGGTGNTALSPTDPLVVLGGDGDDVVSGTDGGDFYGSNPIGASNDVDVFTGGAGDDVMVGKLDDSGVVAVGEDVFAFSGPRANYTVAEGVASLFGPALVVTDTVGTDGTDYLINVGKAQFSDGVVRVFGAPDIVGTHENVALAIAASALLANDIDANLDPLRIDSVTDGVGGTVTLDDNATPGDTTDDMVLFTPTPGFSGEGNFSYTVSDGFGVGDTVLVTVNVAPDGPEPETQTVIVRAAGTGGVAPQFQLVIDGDVVDTFAITTPVTNSAARQGGLVFEDFTFSYEAENGPGTVDIVYFNNANDGPDLDRNLYVDKITVNSVVLESEVDGVLTYNNGVVVGPTETIFKNGTLAFEVPDGGPTPTTQVLEIRAAGTGGPTIAPQFEVFIGGDSFAFDEITTPVTNAERRAGGLVFETFTYEFEAVSPPDNFAIRFFNNGSEPSGDDRNLYIDFITVNDQVFQAEIFGEVIRTNGISDGSIENIDRNATMFFDDLIFA